MRLEEKKMGVDNKTPIGSISVIIDKKKDLLRALEDNNINLAGEKDNEENPKLWFSEDLAQVNTDEYYFDDSENSIFYSGMANTINGEIYVSFKLPLSDVVLIDILQHSIKKLNKLKTALETLK